MIIVLRIANPYIILRQITNLPQLRTSAATGGRRGCITGVFGVGLSRKEGGGRGAKRGNERWER